MAACFGGSRYNPMTSAAFVFGVIPLAFGSGPGAELRHALGGKSHLPQGRRHAPGQELGDGQGHHDGNGHGGPR